MELYETLEKVGIKRIEYSNEEQIIIKKLLDITINVGTGQLRMDTKYRNKNIAIFKFGVEGHPYNKQFLNGNKGTEIYRITIDDENDSPQFTILGSLYIDFMKQVFNNRDQEIYFFPSFSSNRPQAYFGTLNKLFHVLMEHNHNIFEYSIASLDFSWIIDREHHKNLSIIGDEIASHALELSNQSKWFDKVLSRSFYKKYEIDL